MDFLSSRSNDKIKLAVSLRTSAKERRRQGLFFLEGARLCHDAVLSGIDIVAAFFTNEALTKYETRVSSIMAKSDTSYIIDSRLSSVLSDTAGPQGVFCICKTLDNFQNTNKIESNGKYIALDNVQSPDNLGAISRTAEAFGISALILSSGCDIYNPKAQRAAMGSLLRLPVIEIDDLPSFIMSAREKGLLTAASVPDSTARPVTAISGCGGVMCIIGNEGVGISSPVMNACDIKVTIPMKGRAESLNAAAAAAVLMWEMVS